MTAHNGYCINCGVPLRKDYNDCVCGRCIRALGLDKKGKVK